MRGKWQEEKAKEEEKNNPKQNKATIIRSMKNTEILNRMWATMWRYLHQEDRSALTHLMVPGTEKF
eukprot:5484017-Ditylum_brightwellii.AAC.1